MISTKLHAGKRKQFLRTNRWTWWLRWRYSERQSNKWFRSRKTRTYRSLKSINWSTRSSLAILISAICKVFFSFFFKCLIFSWVRTKCPLHTNQFKKIKKKNSEKLDHIYKHYLLLISSTKNVLCQPSDSMDIRKWSVIYINDKRNVTLYIHSWIYYMNTSLYQKKKCYAARHLVISTSYYHLISVTSILTLSQ